MTRWMGVAACAVFVAGSAACDKKDPPGPQEKLSPSVKALASSAPSPSGKMVKFAIDEKSKASIDMPAPKEHIKATTEAASGTLEVDPNNLAASRGEVKIDLTTLTTKTFDDDAKNKSQTSHARCWLEVADCTEGKLPDDVKKANQYAVYAIRSIEAVSAPGLSKVPATNDGAEEVRSVTLRAKGDLWIHGRKVENRDAEVEVQFRYAPGSEPEKPRAITIKSSAPIHVALAEHDVKPRDTFGKIAKASFHLLGTKVADTADISLDLRGAPQS